MKAYFFKRNCPNYIFSDSAYTLPLSYELAINVSNSLINAYLHVQANTKIFMHKHTFI